MSKKIEWKSAPKAKDYEGVKDFLSLLCPEADADALVERLAKADPIERAGKDLLRAAGMPLLTDDDPHVRDDLKDIKKGKALAPVLLIRGSIEKDQPLLIADGYHRICASYMIDEGAPVPCRLIDL